LVARLPFLAAALHAQTSILNTGTPMHVPFDCSREDVQSTGLTCSEEEPCPVYLEISGVEAVGNRLFLAGNLHSANVTLESVLLASDDVGKTWTEPHPRIRSADLEHIQFIDFENGWISGVYLQGVPHDPFFLVTSDGGKTWRASPVFEDGRAGVIERFQFDSKTNGRMLLDTRLHNRHELYESMTGGESWSVRQVSDKPIRWPRAQSGNSQLEDQQQAWRIRADSKTHSYQIEKRQQDRWQTIASFLVDVAHCKL
jgi:hypothetical protein